MINDIDITKIVLSNKQDFKYLFGFKDSEKNRPSCIICQQIWLYIKEMLMKTDVFIF